MFESAELGHAVDKETYKVEAPTLRNALLQAQLELLEKGTFPLLILIAGVDGAGKGETVNLLNEWMDPRHIATHALGELSDEERDRPPIWRFWRQLPPKGKSGIFFGSWYTEPIVCRAYGTQRGAKFDRQLEEVVRFERMLVHEGALILKFWFHLSKEHQKKRLKSLEKNALTRWRVTEREWKNFDNYDAFRSVSERALRATSTAEAPWTVVEGYDERFRALTVGSTILRALRRRLDEVKPEEHKAEPPPRGTPSIDGKHLTGSLDLSLSVPKKDYRKELEKLQGRLNMLTRDPGFKKIGVIAVFEGVDAAGKGGAIRRISAGLDARHYRIIPIAAPTEEEKGQPYLWRFWRHIPRKGHFTIFDRSWYGRVLVERVEAYASEADWRRAYSEINDFEEQLGRHGMVVAKFWLQISKEEQLRRFEERQKIEFKQFKITEEDWRNREKWDLYDDAVCDMVDRTSTDIAPWTMIEANDKLYARLKVLRTLCERIENAL
ncbi:MAG: polyphosphate:AMP phosphotransferase [Polyangiaceae bacterium]